MFAISVALVIVLGFSFWLTCLNHGLLKENGLPDWELVAAYATSDTVGYTEMRDLFAMEKVKAFTIRGETLFMKLSEPLDGSYSVKCELPSLLIFNEDMHTLIEEQTASGIIVEYQNTNETEIAEIIEPIVSDAGAPGNETQGDSEKAEDIGVATIKRVGIISVSDTAYSLSSEVPNGDDFIVRNNIPEDDSCYAAIVELADGGCELIFSDSYGHAWYMAQAAAAYPDVTFVALTGDNAYGAGLPNLKNASLRMYEAWYVSGVAAGTKLRELLDENIIDDPLTGYAAAYPFSECISDYTAFLLGARSVVPEAHMDVCYTNSWSDYEAEYEAASILIDRGCHILSQSSDTGAALDASENALNSGRWEVWYAGCGSLPPNGSFKSLLAYAQSDMSAFISMIVSAATSSDELPTDMTGGFAESCLSIRAVNATSCAPGTDATMDAAIIAIGAGDLHVFDCSAWTAHGTAVTSYVDAWGLEGVELIWDGYFHEGEIVSAPKFDIQIDGIAIVP